jgi:hypothetical protein
MVDTPTPSDAPEPTPLEKFRATVEAYLTRTGIAPATFGLLVCKDQSFVFDLLRDHREPRFSTIEKVEAFMRAHPEGITVKAAQQATGT